MCDTVTNLQKFLHILFASVLQRLWLQKRPAIFQSVTSTLDQQNHKAGLSRIPPVHADHPCVQYCTFVALGSVKYETRASAQTAAFPSSVGRRQTSQSFVRLAPELRRNKSGVKVQSGPAHWGTSPRPSPAQGYR